MTAPTITPSRAVRTDPTGPDSAANRALLAAGVAAGPLFLATVLIQQATRAGVDPQTQPMSLLSQGDLGWIQITNFIICGVLALAAALGLRRSLRHTAGGTWGPAMFACWGFAMIWGGVFLADPAFGFPEGTPAGAPAEISWHSALHGAASPLMGIALIAACLVFARRFQRRGQAPAAGGGIAIAVVYAALTVVAIVLADYRLMLVAGAVIWIWTTVICLLVIRDLRVGDGREPEGA